jgi:hypothetical protein
VGAHAAIERREVFGKTLLVTDFGGLLLARGLDGV